MAAACLFCARSQCNFPQQRAIFRERYAEHISKQRKNLNLIMVRRCAALEAGRPRRRAPSSHGPRFPRLAQIPLLVDPNTGTTMVESRDILLYLRDKYQVSAPRRRRAGYWAERRAVPRRLLPAPVRNAMHFPPARQVGEAPYETIADYSTKGATASHGKLK